MAWSSSAAATFSMNRWVVPNCRGTGFAGRIAVAELIWCRTKISHRLILARGVAAAAIEVDKPCANGTVTMCENGLRAGRQAGTTSLGEILRTVRLDS